MSTNLNANIDANLNTNNNSNINTPRKHEYYIDIARVFSMISVILIHVGAISWYDAPFSLHPWGVMNAMDIMARYCVPVFLMISGYLFLNPDSNITIRKIYTRYLPRLLCAFFFWSFLYALITSGFITARTLGGGIWFKIIRDTFWGHYHMWYMYVIVGLYIITPALRPIAANRQATIYFLIVSYLLKYVLTMIQMIPFIYEHTAKYTNRLELSFISGYVFYYLAGYFFATQDFTMLQRRIIYVVGASALIFSIAVVTIYVLVMQFPNSELHEYYTAGIPLYSIAVFVFFRYRFSDADPDTRIMRIVLWLSKLSFGVYMAHDFGLIVLKKIGITPMIATPFISMPLLTLIDLIITVAIAWAVSLIPGLKKWVM